jgi:hypothetical protein
MFKNGAPEGNVTPFEVRYCRKPGCWQVGVASGAVNVIKTSATVDDCFVLVEDMLWDVVVIIVAVVLEAENPVQGQPL